MRALLLTTAALLLAVPAASQERPWQKIQDIPVGQVQERWSEPAPEYGPQPYHGLGGMTVDKIAEDLDRLKGLGFQAVTAQYGRRMQGEYLSPEYFAFFKAFVAEAKKRNMRVWIVDDAGYPSGFAGGKITSDAPQYRMKALVSAGNWPVLAGQSVDQPVPADFVSASAVDAISGTTRPVKASGGRLRFTAPAEGNWRVIAVAHAIRTSPTKSDTNPSGLKDATHSLIDYLDPAATAAYIRFTHEAYKKALGDEFGKTVLGFRGDEPDYSIAGALPWTPAFFARFQREKGYDIRPFLPILLQGREAKMTPAQLLVRADYYDIFSLMFAQNFFKAQADWCAKNGLQYQMHLNHEEKQIELASSEGDFFRAMGPVQSPGVDAIWHQIWTDTVSDFSRFGSSVAHIHGYPQAMTETFAAFRPAPDLTMAKYVLNQQFVRGINLVEMMYIPAGRPTSGFFADPGFPEWAKYVRRMSYLMSMGRPAAKVAVLQSRGTLWTHDDEADNMFVSTERMLSEMQIDYDLVDEDAVGTMLTAGRGTLTTKSGNAYRTIIVPQSDLMPEKVAARLKAFAAGGGKVLFLGRTPPRLVSKTYRGSRAARSGEFSWATLQPGMLAPVPTPPAQPPAAPPAPLEIPADIRAAVTAAVGGDDLSLARPDRWLRYTHRQLPDARVFLLFNEGPDALSNEVVLKGEGSRVEAWDPATATVTPVESSAAPGGRQVPLSLAGYTTRVLVLR